MPGTFTIPGVTYVAINQGGAGNTVLAAASPGNRHKVVSMFGTMSGAGTLQFLSAATPLGGDMAIAETGGFSLPPASACPWAQTVAGEALSITTTSAAFKGTIGIKTEP